MRDRASIERRSFIGLMAGAALAGCAQTPAMAQHGEAAMYGLIGKIRAVSGQRDALAAVLAEGLGAMPGNLSYVVATDPKDPDFIWVTEVWVDAAAHAASLSLPAVRAAIARGRPLIAGMEQIAETRPIGGHGLVAG